ncbi:MAG: YHS domain-containing protein [Planctomycetes bacterium]|nr:YHS domain-containing protein [Planctomycetota bacterium]
MAEDPVCLVNRDLGCLRVRVDEDTPRATYKGKTYYFCTRMCKAEFERDPEKYVGHETGK